jgi:hypothetical protein
MTDPEIETSREDAFYADVVSFVRRHSFMIALIAPLVLLWLFPMGSGGVLLILVIYLGEAIAYGAMQRVRRGRYPGPAPREDPLAFVARVGGTLARVGLATLVTLVASTIAVAIGLPGVIALLVAVSVGMVLVAWILTRMLRS